MEAQFCIADIKGARQRFYYILASLPPDIVGHCNQSCSNQRTIKKVKEAVIISHEESKPEMLNKLIEHIALEKW